MNTRAQLIDVLFVIVPHSLLLDIARPAEAFRLANQHREARGLPPRFRLAFAGPVDNLPASVGLTMGDLVPLPEQLSTPTWGGAGAAGGAGDGGVFRGGPARDPGRSAFQRHGRPLLPTVHRARAGLVPEPQRDWDMASLADVGNAAERHLLRLFIDNAGISPLHYLRLIRLERARQSLEYGATVTRAAAVAGFGSDVQLRRAWRSEER